MGARQRSCAALANTSVATTFKVDCTGFIDERLKWSYTTGDQMFSSPAIGADGTIYVGSWDSNVYAINPGGMLEWNTLLAAGSNPHRLLESTGRSTWDRTTAHSTPSTREVVFP